jgi:hypothetical protein
MSKVFAVTVSCLGLAILPLACATPVVRVSPPQQRDPSLRFPLPGDEQQKLYSGPMVRAMSLTGLDLQKRMVEQSAPRCLASPEAIDYLVKEGEAKPDGKKAVKVYYVSAWLNHARCGIPDGAGPDESLDYIITEDGKLLKSRIRKAEIR